MLRIQAQEFDFSFSVGDSRKQSLHVFIMAKGHKGKRKGMRDREDSKKGKHSLGHKEGWRIHRATEQDLSGQRTRDTQSEEDLGEKQEQGGMGGGRR